MKAEIVKNLIEISDDVTNKLIYFKVKDISSIEFDMNSTMNIVINVRGQPTYLTVHSQVEMQKIVQVFKEALTQSNTPVNSYEDEDELKP
jgi:hypothetical protein